VLEIHPDHHYLVNPGSVGQPRDRDPQAAYAVFDADAGTVEYRRVAYDVERAAGKILAAGLPEGLAARLFEGM
jgi:diadenosine tetraphosphatase ApaH/serine/threonine PP2A family protein phosphatase